MGPSARRWLWGCRPSEAKKPGRDYARQAEPTAGDILIDPEILITDGSRIQPDARDALEGEGGSISIVADNIVVPPGAPSRHCSTAVSSVPRGALR
jgi:hypothetical protein